MGTVELRSVTKSFGAVEVIKMGVGEQDEVDGREGCRVDGGKATLHPEGVDTDVDADPLREDRVREDGLARVSDEDAGVTKPRGG